MKVFLFVLACLAFCFALFVLVNAKNAAHEIEAGIAFLIATVAIAGAGVIEAIAGLQPKQEK